jgi:hypothetical protein
MNGGILFLDLATTMGWCEGIPGTGDRPASGTVRLAPAGSSPAAIFGGLLDFMATRLTAFRYRLVVYEAPMDPRHMKTNINTARILLGMPAIVEAVAHQTGHHSLREAHVNDVRNSLLGYIPRREKGGKPGDQKAPVIARLRECGYDPKDDNEADAIAGWIYAAKMISGK